MAKRKAPLAQQTDFEILNRDEFAGQGGSYEIVNGKRVKLEGTQPPPPAGEAENGRGESEPGPA